jgi:predicted lipoprotein with Yx(FWY)xxD motif
MRSAIYGGAAVAALAIAIAGCSSSSSPSGSSSPSSSPTAGSSSPAAAANTSATLKTGQTSLGTVLTDAKGFTVYEFAKDKGMTSSCFGACASAWPPVTGKLTAASGITGTLGTISRGGGVLQATYNGHPLYTYAGDTAPGQAGGNDINGFGGLWYAIKISGSSGGASTSSTPTSSPSSSSGYGY